MLICFEKQMLKLQVFVWFPAKVTYKFLLGRYTYLKFPWFWKWDKYMKLIIFLNFWRIGSPLTIGSRALGPAGPTLNAVHMIIYVLHFSGFQ